MKKICIMCFVCLMIFSGCSSDKKKSFSDNKEYLSLLSNSQKADFVLDGQYYEIPFQISQLLENDWVYSSSNEYEMEGLLIPNSNYLKVTFEKGNNKIIIDATNYSDEVVIFSDLMVTMVYYKPNSHGKTDFMVTKDGVTIGTIKDEINSFYAKNEQFTIDNYNPTYQANETDSISFSYSVATSSNKEQNVDSIRVTHKSNETLAATQYYPSDYNSIDEYKNHVIEETKKYLPNNYNQIVIDISKLIISNITFKGTVIDKFEAISENNKYSYTIFLIKDQSGKIFGILFGEMFEVPPIAINQSIVVYGNTYKVYEDENGVLFPIINPKYIESDGEEIYNKVSVLYP